MKTLARFLFIAVVALTTAIAVHSLTGCKSTGQSTASAISYRTLQATQTAVDGAMRVYGNKVALGKVSVESQARVSEAHKDYRAAFASAVLVARQNYSALTPDNVQSLANGLIFIISQL